MRKFLYILTVFFVLTLKQSWAQELNFVRKDVDTSRAKFVTATYLFSLDIVADNLENCTNVTFELRYNKTQFIKFSEWERGSFGPTTKTYIIPLTDSISDIGRIVVSSGMDFTRDTNAPDNPKVVNLKFVVIPAAPHFDVVTFTIINPRATVVRQGRQELIALSNKSISYTIHSFVNVWPGDANNDGVVDHLDFATVSYYLGLGPNTKRMRSFKREPSSTLWAPQPVIAWDTAAATYADCDGNGEVNMIDNLVISYNYNKRHPAGGIIPYAEDELTLPKVKINRTSKSLIFPIFASSYQPYLSLAGKIVIQSELFDFLGIEPAGLLKGNDATFALWHQQGDNIDFSVGTVDKNRLINSSGIIAYLILEPKFAENFTTSVNLSNLMAINQYGLIFPLSAYTNVEMNSLKEEIDLKNGTLLFPPNYRFEFIEIYNSLGEMLYKKDVLNYSYFDLNVLNLTPGAYFIKLQASNKSLFKKYLKE